MLNNSFGVVRKASRVRCALPICRLARQLRSILYVKTGDNSRYRLMKSFLNANFCCWNLFGKAEIYTFSYTFI